MKAFWHIKRINGVLWVRMHAGTVYAAHRPVLNRKEAHMAFAEFIADIRKEK